MANKKQSVLAIYKILKDYSDEKHPLSQSKIKDLLENEYGIEIDRRTLYQNIDMLNSFGVQVSSYTDNHLGYYLVDRLFNEGEIFYLCNAIYSSKYIPCDHSKDLISRILTTQSIDKQKEYENLVYIENDQKKDNKEFFLNLEILSEAIKNHNVVTFEYTKYNLEKNLIPKRDKPYHISPYLMVQLGDKEYLVGRSNNNPEHVVTFRVDKIKDLKVNNDMVYIRNGSQVDPYQYAKNKVYMYDGDVNTVTIKCDLEILDDVVDMFGKKIDILGGSSRQFMAKVKSSKQGMIYLALQYINHMEVIEPVSYREAIKEAIVAGQKKYL